MPMGNGIKFHDLRKDALARGRSVVSLQCTVKKAECPICMESMFMKPVFISPCGHMWHLKCHRKLLLENHENGCCLCRTKYRFSKHSDDKDDEDLLLFILEIVDRVEEGTLV